MIDFTFDSKEFSFDGIYIGYIMNWFGDNFLTSTNVRDQGGYVVFNTHICYDKYGILFYKWLFV